MKDLKEWGPRIAAANDQFKRWERKFKCKKLEKYFEGFQTDSEDDSYVMNLIFSTFNIKKPTLLFRDPIFYVDPRPFSADDFPAEAFKFAQNCEDFLNTIILQPECGISEALELAVIDAGCYFGVVEVQYVAELKPNPLAGMPTQSFENTGTELWDETEPKYVIDKEYIKVKRIPAHRFRVGSHNAQQLELCDWVGYYDFIRIKDLKDPSNGFKNIRKVLETRNDFKDSESPSIEYLEEDREHGSIANDRIKIWRIWDQVEKVFYIMTDGDFIELYSEEYQRLPIFPLIFHRRRQGFYPIPLFFNWLPVQDEINESRQQLRSARRRAKRLWVAIEGAIDVEETEKLLNGPDGTTVWAKRPEAITPIMYPPLDASIGTVLQVSKDDFNIISGTSAEQRGVADRVTATQAAITNQRAQIRDNEEREIVARWICAIGKEILLQARENLTQSFWVRTQHDVGGFFQDVPEKQFSWKQLTSEELGSFDVSISISVESLSPIAQDQEKRKFMEFLAILGAYPIVAMHPELIEEAAYRTGYRNRRVIKSFQQAAMLQMVGQIAGAMPNQGNVSDNLGQKTAEQMTPPTQAQIEGQLENMGVPLK